MKPKFCEAVNEDTPCICGATKEGNDPVQGVCQALHNYSKPVPLLQIVLIDKETGKIVASTR